MARRRKSHKADEENVKSSRSGLKPFRGRTGDNPYVIYADYLRDHPNYPKCIVLNFKELYACKYFVDQLISGDTWVECEPVGSRHGIVTASDVRITMFGDKDIWKVLEYEPTQLEAEWEEDTIRRQVAQFKYGRNVDGRIKDREEDVEEDGERRDTKSKREKVPKEPKVKKAKIDKTGKISANDIAKELGVEGREVRGVLRALKLTKPEGGWLFDKKTADEIREKVKKGLKEQAKKKAKKK